MKEYSFLEKFLKKARVDSNATQADVANHIGTSISYYSALEAGIKPINLSMYHKLLSFFNFKTLEKINELEILIFSNFKYIIFEKSDNDLYNDVLKNLYFNLSNLDNNELNKINEIIKLNKSKNTSA